tara:strand:+ start:41 stop:232 length:192 start_codon:yes stop_codon:yes gene_type:complete
MTNTKYKIYIRSELEKLITDFVVEHNLDAQFVQQTEGLTYVRFVVEEDKPETLEGEFITGFHD